MPLYTKQSSAKSIPLEVTVDGKSLMCNRTKIILITVPKTISSRLEDIPYLCPQKVTGPSYNKHCTTHIFPYRLSVSIYPRQILFTVYTWSGL